MSRHLRRLALTCALLLAATPSMAQEAPGPGIFALQTMLSDRSPEIRVEAARGLGRVGGRRAVLILRPGLMDRTIEVRIAVVEALGFIGGSLALTVLSEALKDRAPVIRIRAVEALKDAGTVNAIPILQKAFGDKESSVRLHVALMLRKIGHKDAHGALTYDLDSGLAHQILDHRSGTEYRARCRGLVDQYHYGPQAQRRRHDKRFS